MTTNPSMLSEEFVTASSDEDGQNNIARAAAAPRKAKVPMRNGKAANGRKTVSLEQDLESDAVSDAVSDEDDVEEDEDASDSESGNSSHSLAEPPPLLNGKRRPSPVANVQEPPRKKMKATAKEPAAIPAGEYHPPNGFEQSVHASKDFATGPVNFLSADLHGKQVWHITAPASVDIKSINGFNIKHALSGKPILSQNGADYGFCTDSQRNEKLLLADGADVEYTQAEVISKTFHLREIIKPKAAFDPSIADSENFGIHFTAQATPPQNQPRQQPAGLQMRYRPFGSVAEPPKTAVSRKTEPGFQAPAELSEDGMEELLNSEKTTKKKGKTSRKKQSGPEIDHMQIDRPLSSSYIQGGPLKSSQGMSEVADGQSTQKVTSAKKEKRLKKKKKHQIADETDA